MRARASSLSWRLVPLAGPLDGGLRLGVARGRLHRRTIRVFAFQHAPYLFELRDFLVDCAKDFLSCYAPQGTASGSSRFSAYPKNGQLLLARSSSSLPIPGAKCFWPAPDAEFRPRISALLIGLCAALLDVGRLSLPSS